MKYSIILPVRNGGEYIKECVNSILAQSLPDFQLQILDNASTDGTTDWLGSLKDDRIKLYPSGRSLTIEENWARITTIPKNEFITLIGHDDILFKDYLATMDRLIAKHPGATLYQTHFSYINASGGLLRHCKPMDEVQTAPEFLATLLANTINVMGTGFMMRGADYDATGGIPPYPNLLFADFDVFLRLTQKAYKATAPEECFSFRLHSSMTTTSADIKFQQAFTRFLQFLDGIRHEDPRYEAMISRYAIDYIHTYCQSLSHRLLRTPRSKRQGVVVADFIRECKQWADKLVPGNDFDPMAHFNIRVARRIDNNRVLQQMFLLFKKMYSKPVYN